MQYQDSPRTGRSALAVILVGLGIVIFIFLIIIIFRALTRRTSTPAVQVTPAAQPAVDAVEKDKLQLIQTDTELIVKGIPPGDDYGILLRDILDDPKSYRGQKVIVNGYIS